MSAKEAPCTNAWKEATLLVEWALIPRGHGSPCDWYAKTTASTIQWANLCLETAFPFCCPPWQTKSCSELLTLRVWSTYMRNALTGHSNAKAGYASSEGSACRFARWQPTLQPFLQERKHYSNRASSGVFSARRTPVREQTPFQCVGLPCWRSSSLNDDLYHCRW